jgi:hypothetical protein
MKTSQLTIIDLAEELKRLAVSVARDARKSSELTCLSSLTAMQPLQSLLLQALTSEINVVNQQESEPKIPFGFAN